jgi:hypothetical protein
MNNQETENPQNTTENPTESVDNQAIGGASANSQEEIRACVDVRLPLSMQQEAMRVAHQENPDNPDPDSDDDLSKAAVETAKKWKSGRTLRVRFLGGHPAVKQKVVQYAKQWEQHCSIRFDFNDAPDAEIRVAFLAGEGSWSYLGTDNLSIPRNEPTMNFGWLTPGSAESEFERVIVHEFGHALGLIHEHQNPVGNIPWNKPVVYNYYQGPPNNWTKADVDNNLFKRYEKSKTQYSKFDKSSIMLYPIPAQFVTDPNFVVGSNTKLSDTDKSFIKSLYP